MLKVAVIIVNWNGIQDTLVCLESLSLMDKRDCDFRVIVVDNGSSNDSVSQIRKKFPDVTVLENTENLGFAGGNNRGMRYALGLKYDYIWLLNNDTKVRKDTLISYIAGAKKTKSGIAGAKIYFDAGHEFHFDRYKNSDRGKVFWYAGGIIDWANMYASHAGVDEVDVGQYDKAQETPFVTGCSMFIRADVLNNIGLFDERYYLYLEDVDLCLRAKKAGYSLWYIPTSVIWHVNAGSSARPGNALQEYYITRNRLLIGYLYAPIRTKFALVRESLKFLFLGSAVKKQAVSDAVFGKYGNRFSLKK